MSGAGLVQLTGLTGKEKESGMRLLMSSLLMKQIRLLFVFGMAVVLTSANAVSAQVLNSFVERAKTQGGPLAAVEAPAVTDAKATEEEEEAEEAQDDDLERRVDLLAEELERLRSGPEDCHRRPRPSTGRIVGCQSLDMASFSTRITRRPSRMVRQAAWTSSMRYEPSSIPGIVSVTSSF